MRERFYAHGLWLRREQTANVDARVSVMENETLCSQMDKSVFCLHFQFLAEPQTRACLRVRACVIMRIYLYKLAFLASEVLLCN